MLDWLQSTTSDLYSLWVSHPTEVALGSLSAAIVLGIALGVRELVRANDQQYLVKYVPRFHEKALRRQRIKYVAALSADAYLKGMENLVYHGCITRFEANGEYRKIANLLKNVNIVPPPLVLRQQLKAAADKKKLHPAAATPPTQNKVGNVVPLRAAFGDKGIRRQKRA